MLQLKTGNGPKRKVINYNPQKGEEEKMKYKISKNGRKARRCNFFEEKEEYIVGIAIGVMVILTVIDLLKLL